MSTMNQFDAKFEIETANQRAFKYHQGIDDEQLKNGTYIKFYYGADPKNLTRMIGKIYNIGFSKMYNIGYAEVMTKCGYHTASFDRIYGFFKNKEKQKIKANVKTQCMIFGKGEVSEELPYMINTLDKMKTYIEKKKLGIIESDEVKDTARTYCKELKVRYPNDNIVTYSIDDKNAHNISFRLAYKRKPFTFKVRNRQGKIDLNFEKVKRMIKRFL